MGTNPVTTDDGPASQLRHRLELNQGPVLTEEQKKSKLRLAEADDRLQEEAKEIFSIPLTAEHLVRAEPETREILKAPTLPTL